MEKNKVIRRGADLRVLEFLKDLQNNIYDSNLININEMSRRHKIGMSYGITLIKLKIITKVGIKKYLWVGSNPSLLMARKILKYYSENRFKNIVQDKQETGQKQIDFKRPVTKPIKKLVVKEQNKNYSFSLFWGLIKIQKS